MRALCILGLVVTLTALTIAATAAEAFKEVTCDQLHFRIEGEYVQSTCKKLVEQKGGDWAVTSEVILAEDLDGVTLVQRSVAGHRSGILKEKARDRARGMGVTDARDWSAAAKVVGYTIHRFRDSIAPMPDASCFYFERYDGVRSGAYGEVIFGMSCVNSAEPVEEEQAAAMLERIVLQ